MQRKIIFLLLIASAQAQIVGGRGTIGGRTIFQVPGTITPPPPSGIAANFWNAGWNKNPPASWPPYGIDGIGFCLGSSPTKCSPITGARIWDDNAKLSQLATCSGSPIVCTFSGGGWTNLKTFVNSNATSYPVNVLYTFGSTPAGAAQPSSLTSCPSPDTAFSCVPPQFIDSNQAACNADGSASVSKVQTDCGNGDNHLWQSLVYQLVNQFKGQVDYWECWNEMDSIFWTNNVAFGGHNPQAANQPQMVRAVRMCSDLKHIVNALDPNAKLVSPSFHVGTALTWFDYFNQSTVNDPGCSGSCSAAIGGITWPPSTVQGSSTYDFPNIHARGTTANNADPASFLTAYNNTVSEIILRGLPKTIFNDEWGCVNQSTPQCPTDDYNAYFVAANLALQGGTWATAYPVVQSYYYQYDSAGGGGSVALQGKIAGQASNTMASWLVGSTPTAKCSNAGSVYTCPLTLASGHSAEIKWNEATASFGSFVASISAASGGNTTIQCTSGCSNLAKEYVTLSGFTNASNNGSFTVVSSTSTQVVVNNPSGVACTGFSGCGNGTMMYTPVTCGTNCSAASSDGFSGTWTDLTGFSTPIIGGQVPLGAKPILLQ